METTERAWAPATRQAGRGWLGSSSSFTATWIQRRCSKPDALRRSYTSTKCESGPITLTIHLFERGKHSVNLVKILNGFETLTRRLTRGLKSDRFGHTQ